MGLAEPDVLRRDYDADLSTFVDFLKSRGSAFLIKSQSNYAQTFLSLASTLNMTILDDVAVAGATGSSRSPSTASAYPPERAERADGGRKARRISRHRHRI